MNAENKRGPTGANLAIFCIPNHYTDQAVLDLCKDCGTVIFCCPADFIIVSSNL